MLGGRFYVGAATACISIAALTAASGQARTDSERPQASPSQSPGGRDPSACMQVTARQGLRIGLDASCSSDPDGDDLTFSWDWGDGTSRASGEKVAHTYRACPHARATITLVAMDGRGGSDAATQTVELEDLDRDGDGLHACRETKQSTSDRRRDSDRDGLGDLTESRWWPRRQRIFCGQRCSFPHPHRRDVYVEVDRMGSGSSSSGVPRNLVLGLRDTFRSHGVHLHVDQGRFGGGDRLSFDPATSFNTSDSDDVDRLYNERFSRGRRGIFHYMILAHALEGDPNCSIGGLGEVPDRDRRRFGDLVLIFRGCLADDGTSGLAHVFLQELGHNLFGAIDPATDAYPCTSSSGHDPYHDRYLGYAMWPRLGGGGSTYHPNRWDTDMQDMGRGIRAKFGFRQRVNKIFEYGHRPC